MVGALRPETRERMAVVLDRIRLMRAVLSQKERVPMVRKMRSSDDRSWSLRSVAFSGRTRFGSEGGAETMRSMTRYAISVVVSRLSIKRDRLDDAGPLLELVGMFFVCHFVLTRRRFQSKAMTSVTCVMMVSGWGLPRRLGMWAASNREIRIHSDALRNWIQRSGAAAARQWGFLHSWRNFSWRTYVRVDRAIRLVKRVRAACRGTSRMMVVKSAKNVNSVVPKASTLPLGASNSDILRMRIKFSNT